MCSLNDGFRLCTCGGDQDADWVLQRLDASLQEQHLRGKAMMPRFDKSAESILAQLRQRNCFDVDYQPQDGDVLMFWGRLRFRHQDGRWGFDRSSCLTGWRAQMVPLQEGCITDG